MNYIEFQVGGKLRGFKFGIGFLGDILKHYDTDLQGFGNIVSKNPFSVLPALLFYGHYHDAIRKGATIDFTIYNVEDWVDLVDDPLNDKNFVSAIQRCIDSIVRYLPKAEEGEEQKKN